MPAYHIPVLGPRSVDLLAVKPGGVYADLTFGGGGHSGLILDALGHSGKLYSFDQDPDARENAPEDPRFNFIAGNFMFMRGLLRERGVDRLDGVLADLGVSSHHFDTPQRGFSFRFDAPLDMRMNPGAKLTAAGVLNKYPEEKLGQIFARYGELEKSYRLAALIVRSREGSPLQTIGQLTELIEPLVPKQARTKYLSKLFQALRIEVNGEIEALKMALEQSLKMLAPGGRLVVISYHSLEDRLVKNFMRSGNFEGNLEKDFYGQVSSPWKQLTRKAIAPSEQEIAENPRSRSAKLRAAEKI